MYDILCVPLPAEKTKNEIGGQSKRHTTYDEDEPQVFIAVEPETCKPSSSYNEFNE